jgi:hypothetical protein
VRRVGGQIAVHNFGCFFLFGRQANQCYSYNCKNEIAFQKSSPYVSQMQSLNTNIVRRKQVLCNLFVSLTFFSSWSRSMISISSTCTGTCTWEVNFVSTTPPQYINVGHRYTRKRGFFVQQQQSFCFDSFYSQSKGTIPVVTFTIN